MIDGFAHPGELEIVEHIVSIVIENPEVIRLLEVFYITSKWFPYFFGNR